MTAALTPAVTIWKKLTAAVFWILAGGLALLGYLFHSVTPRKRPAARHARPAEPKPDDGNTVDWLRAIASPLRKRRVPPVAGARVTAAVLAQMLSRSGQPGKNGGQRAGLAGREGLDLPSVTGHLVPPLLAAQLGLPGVPAADLDQHLTEHAELYAADFDELFPVLAGELAPLPWIGVPVGDIVFEPTLPPLPEPVQDWRPHACGDVDQPTAILRPFESELTEDQVAKLREAFTEALASGKTTILPPGGWQVTDLDGNPLPEISLTQDVPGPAATASLPPVHCGLDGCTIDHTLVPPGHPLGRIGRDPEDVPGPAGSAPAPPGGQRENGHPPAAVAGPGTPTTPGPASSSVRDVTEEPGRAGGPYQRPRLCSGPGVPDDTVTDMPAIADRTFVHDIMARDATPADILGGLTPAQYVDRLFAEADR